MNVWLVGLGLALLCTVSAESECSGVHHQGDGKWYVTALATDCDHLLKQKDVMKIIIANVIVKSDSKLLITTNFPKEEDTGKCRKMVMEFDKMDDGTYVHTSDNLLAKKMEVVSTDCNTYAMVRAQIEHRGKTSNHLALYTRTPEMPSDLKEKFLETSRSLEFTSDQIILPHGVACQDEE